MQFIKAEWVFSHPEHSKWVKDLSFSFSQHIVESGIFLPGFSDRQWREQGCVELPPHVHILGAQSQGSSESPALDVTVTHCWPSTHGRISLQQAKPSLASPVWAQALCICSADVPSLDSPASCSVTCSGAGTPCAIFCAFGKPLTPVFWIVIEFPLEFGLVIFFPFSTSMSFQCPPNIYTDQYLLSALALMPKVPHRELLLWSSFAVGLKFFQWKISRHLGFLLHV